MKSPNNPYNIKDILPTFIPSAIKGNEIGNKNEILDWYLEEIYQIEVELKSQYLDKEYKRHLIKKHNYLLVGLKCFFEQCANLT